MSPWYFLAVRFEVLESSVVPLDQNKGMAMRVSRLVNSLVSFFLD